MNKNQIELVLPRPHKGQQNVIESIARFRCLCCGRRWGKSIVAALLTVDFMIKGKKVAYLSPTHDLNTEFFTYLSDLIPQTIIKKDNKSELFIELVTKGSVKFFSGQSMEQFRGRHFDFLVIDEAAHIVDLENAYNTIIRATLLDRVGKVLFISTPNGRGTFFETIFLRGKNQEKDYESWHYTTYDNPHISIEEIEAIRAEILEDVFKQEYLAISLDSGSCPFKQEYLQKGIIKVLSNLKPIIFGIDLARVADFTVITGIDENGNICFHDRFQLPWEMTLDKIKSLPTNIPKYVDGTGVGSVLVELLQSEVPNINGYTFTNESKNNIIYQLVKDVEKGNLKYTQIYADEMSNFGYKVLKSGKIQFNAISGHDDCVCSLALANYHRKKYEMVKNWKLYRC